MSDYVTEALHDATLQQLVDELKIRFPVCIFVGLREAMGDATSSQREAYWAGCVVSCIGLLEVQKLRLLQVMNLGLESETDDA